MGLFDKIKKSISSGDDDDNTYDDDEFEDDYSMGSGGYSDAGGMNDNMASFNQQNPLYTQMPNYNNFQQPIVNSNSVTPATSVTSISGGDMHASLEVKVIKPEKFLDGRKIADLLMARKTVIVNFEETNREIARRLLDFMAGVSYTLKGDLKRISETTFIVTPPNVTFSEEHIRSAERGEVGRDSNINY